MKHNQKPTQRKSTDVTRPFLNDTELLGIECQEVHIPSDLAVDVPSEYDLSLWDRMDKRLDIWAGKRGA